MKQKIKNYLIAALLLSSSLSALAPLSVSAVVKEPGSGSGGGTSACGTDEGVDLDNSAYTQKGDCTAKTDFKFGTCGNTNVSISCVLTEVMRFLTILVGISVVAGITVGGIVYATGSGNAARTQKGVTIIVNSIIGLVLYALMFAIINFLIPGGIFN